MYMMQVGRRFEERPPLFEVFWESLRNSSIHLHHLHRGGGSVRVSPLACCLSLAGYIDVAAGENGREMDGGGGAMRMGDGGTAGSKRTASDGGAS
jgi:hypothetical protein